MSMHLEITPESREVIDRLSNAGARGIEALDRALQKITAWLLRETMMAFDNHRQPGGAAWEPNYGDEPGGYAWFKREILGLRGDSTGVINGELRDSMAQEIEGYPSLTSRVGTPKASSVGFSEGGDSGPFFLPDHSGRFWRFPGGPFPARPFLPESGYAEDRAAAILQGEMERFAAYMETGMELAGGGDAGVE